MTWKFGIFFKITIFLKISLVNNVFKLFRKLISQVSYRLKFTITTRVLWTQVQHCPNFKKKKKKKKKRRNIRNFNKPKDQRRKRRNINKPIDWRRKWSLCRRYWSLRRRRWSLCRRGLIFIVCKRSLLFGFDLRGLGLIFVVWVWSSWFDLPGAFVVSSSLWSLWVWSSWFMGLIYMVCGLFGFDLPGVFVVSIVSSLWVWCL